MSDRCDYCGRLTELGTFGMLCPHCEPEDDVPALKRRIEKLETALERIRDHDKIILGEHMDQVRQIAREALE